MSKTPLQFAPSVRLYARSGRYLRLLVASHAQRLHRQGYTERICSGPAVRAMQMCEDPPEPLSAKERALPRLSGVGSVYQQHFGSETQRPSISYQMRAINEANKRYAPAEFRGIYLAVVEGCTR